MRSAITQLQADLQAVTQKGTKPIGSGADWQLTKSAWTFKEDKIYRDELRAKYI
jgi:hypothetical protein